MGKSEKRKTKNASQATTSPAIKTNHEALQASNNLATENLHDYVKTDLQVDAISDEFMLCEEEFPSLLDTPCKSPAAKQRKTNQSEIADVLSQLGALSQLINTRSDSLEKIIGENTRAITNMKEVINENTKQITSVKEAIEFMSEEVNCLKTKCGAVESKMGKMEQTTSEQERRLAHLESYSRRWNLRIYGVPEKEREDVRLQVIQLCQRLLPEDRDKLPNTIDIAHRLGRKQPNKTRGVIVQFASRFYRDAVWRAAKESTFLRENGLKISEDLSPADKERRNKLWPAVEKARQNNKRAYFIGGRAFVEGIEIFPPA
ncbi:uncharacterized protein LOC113073003 [Carassius auratus]|uniref:Uncharacterized protein LOC113073003 n=1 Tax=Carassius auratus TaxID=7957 RepID=A0A6P6MZF3_CARAU|nr:uncharacterized protein LOC113073003 [Carassius auratus]